LLAPPEQPETGRDGDECEHEGERGERMHVADATRGGADGVEYDRR
jgi:hypothetical protein